MYYFFECVAADLGPGLCARLQGLYGARSGRFASGYRVIVVNFGRTDGRLRRGQIAAPIPVRALDRDRLRVASGDALLALCDSFRGQMGGADGPFCVGIFFVVVSRSGHRGDSRHDAAPGSCNFGGNLYVPDAAYWRLRPASHWKNLRYARFAGRPGNFGWRTGLRRTFYPARDSFFPA